MTENVRIDTCGSGDAAGKRLSPGLFAVIDIGTVTCRFLCVRIDAAGACEVLDRGYRICNLGVGVDATGHLREDAMDRVAAAVGEFVARRDAIAAAYGLPAGEDAVTAIPTACVATSASRDARNADEFRARIEAAGVHLSIIPGEREAALSFAGASADYPGLPVVVIDIGGGSTEVIAGEGGGAPAFARSFNVGCRRITERFLHTDPPTAKELAAARAWAADIFAPYLASVPEDGFAGAQVVAVAGTATSVVSVELAMAAYDPSRVHGAWVSREVLRRMLDTFAGQTCEARAATQGLDPKRADVIVGGLLTLDVLLELLGAPGYAASEADLMHGAAFALARGERF